MSGAPSFPPLLHGMLAQGDPFAAALDDLAGAEAEPGRVYYAVRDDALHAALVLAPDMPLADAMGALIAVQLGLSDALGALAPPEVAVQARWPDILLVNGGVCGRFRAAASGVDPAAEPDWLVLGLEVDILPAADFDPGLHPDRTTLYGEGCSEVAAIDLIEAWSRHMMSWLHTFMSEGVAPLHTAWSAKCAGLGEDVTLPQPGRFLGLDEKAGMILRRTDGDVIFPLTDMLEPSRCNSPE
jgi:BirA family biotin operon repressor/biotin-[acetyl-CoA-carboxylase] ligase